MKRNTLEVGLHQWEPWHESIERSRRELGFDPAWPDEKVNQWAVDNYVALIRPRAEAEVAALRLPPSFFQYWEDCFYNEYKDASGRPHPERVRRLRSDRNSAPPLPFDASLSWDSGEDVHDPWLPVLIRIHAEFCTRELFNAAANHAWVTLRNHLWLNHTTVHPVAVLARKVRPNTSERKRSAQDRFMRQEATFEDLLREVWMSEEIQGRLQEIMESGASSQRRKRFVSGLRKIVYDRVRRWLGDDAPLAPRRGRWQEAMPTPDARPPSNAALDSSHSRSN